MSHTTPPALLDPTPLKPTIVGLYGVSGCGKSHLLNLLKTDPRYSQHAFFEGSTILDDLVPGGLDAFKGMAHADQTHWRDQAISHIIDTCTANNQVGIVVGHMMFWDDESKEAGQRVWTEGDACAYTHIIYLTTPPTDVVRYRASDSQRPRAPVSEEHIRRWQEAECEELRRICLERKIIFTTSPPLLAEISTLVDHIQHHTEERNLVCVQSRLDDVVAEFEATGMNPNMMLVFDGDKTFIAEDTGKLFWELAAADATSSLRSNEDPLNALFSSPFGYTYPAFLQAAFLYKSVDDAKFVEYCQQVAAAVTIHPEILSLLAEASKRRVAAVLVTCGVRLIWEKILSAAGLSETVKIIGGGRIRDKLVVTPRTKAAVVARLRDEHHIHACAFGDSPLDLPMLKEAEMAVVVVGEERTRSRSMDKALSDAIVHDGLKASQWLLPSNVSPRLDTRLIPLANIGNPTDFVDAAIRLFSRHRVFHATDEHAAKLLMTPMRDARICALALQEAHANAGWYLALTYLPRILGVENVPIRHVQGHETSGHRVRHEKETVIVALMRGGEPMARGVWKALPLAMFVHAKKPEELRDEHLVGRKTIVLVDSVVNSGKSVDEFVYRIRELQPTIRIVVVAGVIQTQSISDGLLGDILARDDKVGLVALRLSENKYTGKGTTDTGNRLFNSTQID
ncbi:uracil phosphoribosyltransferase-domain-containing protein [Roridomyces roridus]|uniref:Uracil phosphoribosyltransferase-domain-containing protein n=1 Tax=Roridomyces roridus TaxID=1738132 RepID=A0AAD7AXH9_9AGAR|nr:uracil phosphoribosyltransferase-domain-containing protein [Roridomyces roridus]